LLSERLNWAVEQKLKTDPSLKKITQVSLARVADLSGAAVSNWFSDKNGIDAEPARRLGAFLGVDPLWLESGKGDPIQKQGSRHAESTSSEDLHHADISDLALEVARAFDRLPDGEKPAVIRAVGLERRSPESKPTVVGEPRLNIVGDMEPKEYRGENERRKNPRI